MRSRLPPWTGPRLQLETSSFAFSPHCSSHPLAFSCSSPLFSCEFLRVLIQLLKSASISLCLPMSLLEIPDFNVEEGTSRMLLAHCLDGSPKPILLKDHTGDTPCGPSSSHRGAACCEECRPASLAGAIGVRTHRVRIPAQNYYRWLWNEVRLPNSPNLRQTQQISLVLMPDSFQSKQAHLNCWWQWHTLISS